MKSNEQVNVTMWGDHAPDSGHCPNNHPVYRRADVYCWKCGVKLVFPDPDPDPDPATELTADDIMEDQRMTA